MPSTVFITGASSGIGKAAARLFQHHGWQVAATMRKPENENQLGALPGVKLYALDVQEADSIAAARDAALADFGSVEALVNNAGYAAQGVFEAANDAEIRRQFDTNVFGLMEVSRAFLPHFRQQQSGTLINLSSVGGRFSMPILSLYHATKFAVEGFSESLRFELAPFNIRVKLIEPGPIKTDFYSRSMAVLAKDGLSAYDEYQSRVRQAMNEAGQGADGPEKVARVIYRAATDGKKKLRYPAAGNAPLYLFLKKVMPDSWFVAYVRSRLEKG